MGDAIRNIGRLLWPAVPALGPRHLRAAPSCAGRPAEQPVLFLLYRAVASGGLLPHRPVDPRCARIVLDECGRGPHLVWLSLPTDGVDRSFPNHRTLGRGR